MALDKLLEDSETPAGTRDILYELIQRKEMQKKWQRRASIAGTLLILAGSGLCLDLFFFQNERAASLEGLVGLLRDPLNWFFSGCVVVLTIIFMHVRHQADDAEDDFDQLREEMIERGEELWPKEYASSGKYRIMKYLLKEKNINLFYK